MALACNGRHQASGNGDDMQALPPPPLEPKPVPKQQLGFQLAKACHAPRREPALIGTMCEQFNVCHRTPVVEGARAHTEKPRDCYNPYAGKPYVSPYVARDLPEYASKAPNGNPLHPRNRSVPQPHFLADPPDPHDAPLPKWEQAVQARLRQYEVARFRNHGGEPLFQEWEKEHRRRRMQHVRAPADLGDGDGANGFADPFSWKIKAEMGSRLERYQNFEREMANIEWRMSWTEARYLRSTNDELQLSMYSMNDGNAVDKPKVDETTYVCRRKPRLWLEAVDKYNAPRTLPEFIEVFGGTVDKPPAEWTEAQRRITEYNTRYNIVITNAVNDGMVTMV